MVVMFTLILITNKAQTDLPWHDGNLMSDTNANSARIACGDRPCIALLLILLRPIFLRPSPPRAKRKRAIYVPMCTVLIFHLYATLASYNLASIPPGAP